MHQPEMTPIAEIGDLIIVKGYGNRLFRIDAYTHEFVRDITGQYEEIYYDCHCVVNAEYTLASQEDVYVMCKKYDSDQYLTTYQAPVTKPIYPEVAEMFNVQNPNEMPKKKEPTKRQRIDALLDERNSVLQAQELVGIQDHDGYYGDRLAEIDAQLSELTTK